MINRKTWFPKDLSKETKIIEQTSKVLVSEEQLLKSKINEDNSPYFHDQLKGCEIEDVLERYRGSQGSRNMITIKFCKTHNCKCHKDGWRIGFWGGSRSK